MSLSEAEKKQIEQEEREKLQEQKYRNEVRKNLTKTPWWKPKGFLTWLVVILILGWFVSAIGSFSKGSVGNIDTDNLNGDVTYKDFKFSITNADDKEWNYCHFTLNNDYHYPGNSFSDKTGPIQAGKTIVIPSGQFAKGDGTRFSPLLVKPQSLGVDCNKRFGFWKW